MRVNLRGVFPVKSRGKVYYYAWRGGPRLDGEPGSPEFIASYNRAIEERHAPDPSRFRSLVVAYKASDDWKRLADSTKAGWSRWLDSISDHFGSLPVAAFDRRDRIRPIILKWRSAYSDHPRTADYAIQVLSRVLSFAVEGGRLSSNACDGIKNLYSSDRSEIIWTDADIAAIKKVCSAEIGYAVDLGAHTGLRLGDLLRLSWSHVHENHIEISTGKSRHRRTAIIPLYDELKAVLARIPKRATTVLTNSYGRPWKRGGWNTPFDKAKKKAGLYLHFHDLRGTCVTKLYIAGIKIRMIAEIVGWSEESAEKIIRKYVGRDAMVKDFIRQMREQKGNES